MTLIFGRSSSLQKGQLRWSKAAEERSRCGVSAIQVDIDTDALLLYLGLLGRNHLQTLEGELEKTAQKQVSGERQGVTIYPRHKKPESCNGSFIYSALHTP